VFPELNVKFLLNVPAPAKPVVARQTVCPGGVAAIRYLNPPQLSVLEVAETLIVALMIVFLRT
jgi:hypothetical protein